MFSYHMACKIFLKPPDYSDRVVETDWNHFPLPAWFAFLDLPADIEQERNLTIRRRPRYETEAFAVFCMDVVYGSCVLVSRLLR